ncbi:hypothetical protein FOVG_16285 [Fusarium oxysporum f. sp. pisi HDV247]|nr:hypothetical protein FOVG_16285 [Fusarium oxysporum f. sp. pisi HDV247]EXA32450.1 hypothetical protein FOVG_16285 [Fusarium oxysporum f. sp. pisi HDV247]
MCHNHSLGQAIIERNMWDTDDSWNSQHLFSDTTMQFGISGFLPANLPTTYEASTKTASNHFAYVPGMESRNQDSSGPVFPAGNDSKSLGLMVPSRSNLGQDPGIQLRSASCKSKNRKRRHPASSNSQAHARKCHNLVEKQYRTRLKAQFENLLAVLPTAQDPDSVDKDATGNPGRYLSRGQVLDAARERILKLENEVELSTLRRNWLLKDMERMERTLLDEKSRAALSF